MSGSPTTGAGASARREHERRKARDEAALRDRWGRLGNVAVALSDERQSTAAWRSGAVGEETVGARLDRLATESTRVLHDRRVPRSRANIDHLVVTPAGVWVIDSKRYQGRRPSLQVEGGLFRPRVEHLTVGGRKKSTLVAGVQRQLELVRATVSAPVFGALCFVDADWPLFGGSFTVDGINVLWPRKLEALLRKSAGSTPVEATTQLLERRFMPA